MDEGSSLLAETAILETPLLSPVGTPPPSLELSPDLKPEEKKTPSAPEEEHTVLEIGSAECRICQEEDEITNLEVPCACAGSVKYAHRKCIQRWCNEKKDTICEICHHSYQNGYTAPPRTVLLDDISIDFSEEWDIAGPHPLEFRDPRILALVAAQHRLLDADYDDFAEANSSGATYCRSIVLILIAVFLLRHALVLVATNGDEDTSMFLLTYLLRAAGFLLPCYVLFRTMNMLQQRRQRQEARMAAAEVGRLLQAGHAQAVHLPLSSGVSTSG